MKYSKNPKDWYFDVFYDGEDTPILYLSQDPNMLDDQLGSHNLPKDIFKLFLGLGFYMKGEVMESCWEFDGQEFDVPNLINDIKNLGFNHCTNFY